VGAFVAGHGKGGLLEDKVHQQLEESRQRKAKALASINQMGISAATQCEACIWQLAELANAVYTDPAPDTHDFRCDLACARCTSQEVDSQMAVYISRQTKLAVLAIRGTNLHDISDLKRDLISIIGFGHPTAIVTRAAELVQRYQQDGYGVMVTGHSSGGYMAEIIATTLGLNGIGFCAPGPGEHNGEQRPRGFHAINHESDLIGNHNAGLHAASPIYVTDDGLLQRSSNAHSMENMLCYMRKRDEWTNMNVIGECKMEMSKLSFHVFPGFRTFRP